MSTNNLYVMLGIKEWPIILLFAFSFIIAALACVLVMMEEWKEGKPPQQGTIPETEEERGE